jgi:hypothetical protein
VSLGSGGAAIAIQRSTSHSKRIEPTLLVSAFAMVVLQDVVATATERMFRHERWATVYTAPK